MASLSFRGSLKIMLLGFVTFFLFQDTQSKAYELNADHGYKEQSQHKPVYIIDTAIKPITYSLSSSAGKTSSCFSSQYHSMTTYTPAQSGWDQHAAGDKPDFGVVIGFTLPLSNSKSAQRSGSLTQKAHFSLRQPHLSAERANKLRSDNRAYNCHEAKSYMTFR